MSSWTSVGYTQTAKWSYKYPFFVSTCPSFSCSGLLSRRLSSVLPSLSLSPAGEKECGESGCGCDHSKTPPPLAGVGWLINSWRKFTHMQRVCPALWRRRPGWSHPGCLDTAVTGGKQTSVCLVAVCRLGLQPGTSAVLRPGESGAGKSRDNHSAPGCYLWPLKELEEGRPQVGGKKS